MSDIPFFKVRIANLNPQKTTTFDLFVSINGHHTLYLRAGDVMSAEKIESLARKDVGETFLVPESQRRDFKQYIHEQMQDESIPVATRAKLLKDSSITLVEEIFENPDVDKALDDAKPIVSDFVRFMEQEPEAMSHLISLSGHDFYTYNHSLDVSIYALGLGQAVGFKPADIEELGLGSLFHDIGKRQVSLDILCKNGPLDDAEWAQMQQHPQYGLMILNGYSKVSDAVKACCFEHHESFLGNGYPQQLRGPDIHPFARIIAITDTYDAMTTQRSYNVPMKPRDALNMMKEKLKGRYDPDMLNAMHSVLFQLEKIGA